MSDDPGRGPLAAFSRDLRDLSWLYVAQGAALILLGVLILVFPDLLSILVATFLVLGGIVTLAAGWRVRRARRAFEDIGRLFWD